jgi:3-oxoacyl-[acyl-carrier-protein] synthase-3
MQASRYAHITGWGAYVPPRCVTNAELSQLVPTSDAWIRERTGIETRHIADDEDHTSTMAIKAGRKALQTANLDPGRLGLVICATSTPDYLMPNTASLIQDGLGATHAAAFDLNTACSGFVYALSVAASMLRSGAYDSALVIGAESMSRVMDWTDRTTCVLFGDGAGAVVLQASERPGGVLSFRLGSDGSGGDVLTVGMGTRNPITPEGLARGEGPFMKMAGREVYRFATRIVDKVTREVVEDAELEIDDIDLIIPHQANIRILAKAAKQLGIPIERIYSNLDRYGNTSAASVPLALVEAIQEDRIHAGDHVVMVGFGGGLTWGATLVEWTYDPADREWSLWQRGLQGARFGLAGVKSFAHRAERGVRFWEIRMRRRARRRKKAEENGADKAATNGQLKD